MVETRRSSTSAKHSASPRPRSAKRSKRSSPELTTPAVALQPRRDRPRSLRLQLLNLRSCRNLRRHRRRLRLPAPADRAEGCPVQVCTPAHAEQQLAKMMGTMDFQRKQLARSKSKVVWGKLLSQYSEVNMEYGLDLRHVPSRFKGNFREGTEAAPRKKAAASASF